MPPRVLIVSGADNNFFPLLKGLILSLHSHEEVKKLSLAFLDLGLLEEQVKWLKAYTDMVVVPQWDVSVPDKFEGSRHYMGFTARMFLRKYFPGFDVYMWIDADAWLQDSSGLNLYIEGANRDYIAATPHVDRSYFLSTEKVDFRYRLFKKIYGVHLANVLLQRPYLNAGIFAVREDAPHWDIFAAVLQTAVTSLGHVRRANQVAFNAAIYLHNLPVQLLPAICNWQCSLALPIWDEKRKLFCEPFLPFQPIYFMHLTGITKGEKYFQIKNRKTSQVKTITGETMMTDLRYSSS